MINAKISANKVIGSLIYRTREALRKNKKFISDLLASPFGANYYINGKFNIMHVPGTIQEIRNNILELDKSTAMREHKYPAVFNYEQKRYSTHNGYTTATINLSFVAITDKNWTTEEREAYVFDPVLRPIFSEFFNQIKRAPFLRRQLTIEIPQWDEIFTTGDYGDALLVAYGDWLDAIEVRNFNLIIRDCDSPLYEKIIEENNKLTEL